jgi:hypothetical protein
MIMLEMRQTEGDELFSIPKGLYRSAQGCESRATLGTVIKQPATLKEVSAKVLVRKISEIKSASLFEKQRIFLTRLSETRLLQRLLSGLEHGGTSCRADLGFPSIFLGKNHVLPYTTNTAQNQVEADLGGSFVREKSPCFELVRRTLT